MLLQVPAQADEPRNRQERRALAAGYPPLAYSIDAFAEAINGGRSKVYEEIRAGRLKAKKYGARTLILAPDASERATGLWRHCYPPPVERFWSQLWES